MDIQKIINNKVAELVEGEVIEKLVAETVETSIKKEIESYFSGWNFRRDIEDKLKEEISPMLKTIDFSGYRQVMINQMVAVVSSIQGEEFAQMAKSEFESIFGKHESIKLTELFEKVRENFKNDEYAYEEYFTVIISDRRTPGDKILSGWIDIYFDADENKSNYECRNHISIMMSDDKVGVIKRLKINGVNYSDKGFQFGYLNDWEKSLLNAYFSETLVAVDIDDEDDIDTTKWDD